MTPTFYLVQFSGLGICRVCHTQEDLRMGSCFRCCEFINGKRLDTTTHLLWDRRNPLNCWRVTEGLH